MLKYGGRGGHVWLVYKIDTSVGGAGSDLRGKENRLWGTGKLYSWISEGWDFTRDE
jgi:hypothetical protein